MVQSLQSSCRMTTAWTGAGLFVKGDLPGLQSTYEDEGESPPCFSRGGLKSGPEKSLVKGQALAITDIVGQSSLGCQKNSKEWGVNNKSVNSEL